MTLQRYLWKRQLRIADLALRNTLTLTLSGQSPIGVLRPEEHGRVLVGAMIGVKADTEAAWLEMRGDRPFYRRAIVQAKPRIADRVERFMEELHDARQWRAELDAS